MMVRFIRFLSSSLLLFIALAMTTTAPVILAQATCPTIIQDAITVLGNSCDGISRNNACYGNIDVEAQFNLGYEQPFEQPGDLAQLVNMQRLTTAPIDLIEEEWGIALLSMQANIPDTIPGQSVIFMLLGDSEIENGVQPDGTLSNERIPVITRRSGSLRAEPSASSRILTFIPGSTEIGALGVSEDGEWLRVTYNGQSGWIIARMVQTIPEFDTPTNSELYTPMQSFYLRTGIGRPDCVQAPNTLMVQGPKDFSIDLTVNGAEIRIGSTVFLRNIAPDVMQLIVAEGQATLYPDTPDARIVPAGGFSTICLDAPRDLGVDGEQNDRAVRDTCFWTTPQLFTNWDEFEILDDLPPNLLIYDFTFPDDPIIVDDCEINPEWTSEYIVQVNDNLSLIAPRYNLTPEELGFGNCLSNYDLIYPEQILQVPPIAVVYNPPPTENPPAVTTPPVTTPPPTPYVDLQLTLTTSDATPEENMPFNYSLSVTNLGTQDATGVMINLPCPSLFVECSSFVAGGGTYDFLSGNWSIGTITAGTTVSLQLNVYARPGEANAGIFTIFANLMTVVEPDTNVANNTSMASVDIDYYSVAIQVNDASQVIANDGLCTLTEAINNANGNTFSGTAPLAIHECAMGKVGMDAVQLTTNISASPAPGYVNGDGINAFPFISSDIGIDGLYHTITMGGSGARFFHVDAGANFILKSVTLTGAVYSGLGGGAVFNRGSLNIIDGSQITMNQLNTAMGGGAIFSDGVGASVVISNGSSINNNQINGSIGGAGIKMSGGNLTITNADVSNNNANTGVGGGISCTDCILNISGGATIANNTASEGAGIYYTNAGAGSFTISSAVFTGNTALVGGTPRGGAIFFNDVGASNITASFNGNRVSGFGGAFYVLAGTVNFNNTTFTGNENVAPGGQGGVGANNGVVNFNNVTFTSNLDAGSTATVLVNFGIATATFSNNTLISVGHNGPQCAGVGFTNDATNTGGDGSCYP